MAVLPISLMAIDPGVHTCACAVFRRGLLDQLGYDLVTPVVEAIVEKPQADSRVGVYNIDLACRGAELAGRAIHPRGVVLYTTPTKWKQSVPKPICHARALKDLSSAELSLLPDGTAERVRSARESGAKDGWRKPGAVYYGRGKGSDVHNLLDAVALGLWHLGRTR